MGTPTEGVTTKLAFDTELPFDTSSIPVSFISDGLRSSQAKRAPQGITGSRSQKAERVRKDVQNIAGDIVIPMSPTILDFILPFALGGAESTDSFPLDETLSSFFVLAERGGQTFQYEVYVNKFTLKGATGGMCDITLSLIGVGDETEDAVSFPVLTEPTDPPYQIEDLVLQYAAAVREIDDFDLSVDNVLSPKFRNSITAQHVTTQNRIVLLKTTNPWSSDEEALYRLALGGTAGLLTFTNGALSTTATMPAIEWKDDTPIVSGKTEVPFTLEGQCFKSGTTDEIVFTNDPVP